MSTKKGDAKVLTVGAMRKLLDNFYQEKVSKLEVIVEENKALKEQMAKLEDAVEDLSCYTRRNNLIVYGVPAQVEERAGDFAVKLSNLVGIRVSQLEIDMAHRLPSRNKEMPQQFIIKYVSRFTKEEVLEQAKTIRPTDVYLGTWAAMAHKRSTTTNISRQKIWQSANQPRNFGQHIWSGHKMVKFGARGRNRGVRGSQSTTSTK